MISETVRLNEVSDELQLTTYAAKKMQRTLLTRDVYQNMYTFVVLKILKTRGSRFLLSNFKI